MAKLQIKSETIVTYGGIFKIMELFERLVLGKLVDSSLGKRDASWNAFQYSDVVETIGWDCQGGRQCRQRTGW